MAHLVVATVILVLVLGLQDLLNVLHLRGLLVLLRDRLLPLIVLVVQCWVRKRRN